ncbi:MAG: LysM domain-containing protein, partial [Caldithrix sp.]
MKKYILATLFLGLFVLFLEPAETLLSNFLRLEQPTLHKIEDGDWLSKIALQYYGDSTFWQELELINRVPEGNLVFPGENIIVPSFKIIQQIRNTKKLSEVNKLIKEQQNILVSTSIQPNNYQEVEKSQSERIATVTVKKPDESEVVKEVGRIIGFEQELAESSSDKASITSSILFAGVVALCLGFVIAIFYFM